MSEIDGCVTLLKRSGKNVSNRLFIPNAQETLLIVYFKKNQIVFFCPSMNKYVHTWENKL